MPTKKIVTIKDFRGGLVTTRYAKDGEFSLLSNFCLVDGVLHRRYGMKVYPVEDAGGAMMNDVIGVMSLTRASGTWNLIAFNPAGMTKVVLNGVSVALTDPMALAFASNNNLWRSCQYKNYGYAVRSGLTYILRFNDTSYWSNGIAAPTTNAVIGNGAAGTIQAGNYYGVYTFVDADGVESAPSPVSALWTSPGAVQASWSSVDVSTNPRVTQRKLYRTMTNQIGEYFYVATINDNTSTTASEDIGITGMGDLSPDDNVVPPTKNYIDIATCYERLWAADVSYVYGSAAEDPDSFPPANVYAFSPDDGQAIKALCRHGSTLMVLKTGSVWALDQTLGAFEFVPRLVDDRNGCVSTHSVVSAGGRLFWWSGKGVFMSDGRSPGVDISSGRLGALAHLPSGYADLVLGAAFPTMGWYVCGLKGLSNDLFVYDYNRDYWFTITNQSGVKVDGVTIVSGGVTAGYPTFLATALASDGTPRVYGQLNTTTGLDALIYDLFASDYYLNLGDEGGTAGTSFITSGGATTTSVDSSFEFIPDLVSPAHLHSISRILLQCETPSAPGNVLDTVTVYMDPKGYGFGPAASSKSRSAVTIPSGYQWKNIGLSSRTKKSSMTAIRIASSAKYDLPIYAIQVHGELFAWYGNPS